MAKPTARNLYKLRQRTRSWLETRALPQVKEVARDLENAGEDVTELLDAINELESLIDHEPGRTGRSVATAES